MDLLIVADSNSFQFALQVQTIPEEDLIELLASHDGIGTAGQPAQSQSGLPAARNRRTRSRSQARG
jgi:hypothetical protein